jgi:hypothetical protein
VLENRVLNGLTGYGLIWIGKLLIYFVTICRLVGSPNQFSLMVSPSQRAYSVTHQNYHDNIDTYYDVKIISISNPTHRHTILHTNMMQKILSQVNVCHLDVNIDVGLGELCILGNMFH